jgi:hypothetical protein
MKLQIGNSIFRKVTFKPTTPQLIEEVPTEGTKKLLGSGAILYADADKMSVDFTDKLWFILFKLFFILLPSFGFLYFLIKDIAEGKFDAVFHLLFIIPIIIFGLFFSVKYIYRPKRVVVFNRKEGTLDVPFPGITGWSGKKRVGFDLELLFMPFIGMYTKTVVISYPNGGRNYVETGIDVYDYKSSFSFIFWYMDPNRPLPPGEIFDSYRQADFERRRAEGFPLPKIDSRIDTPEATLEQQQERNAVWPKNLAGVLKNKK